MNKAIIIIAIIYIVYIILKIIIKKENKGKINEEETNKIDYNKYYEPKRYIITINELIFYKILLEIAKELNLILLCQVSLYSILKTKTKNYTYFNKISSKSIDFVLARQNDCRIKLCIELDDKTHNYPERIKRDKFINDLFKDLNINLLRIKSKPVYDKENIKQQILELIKE